MAKKSKRQSDLVARKVAPSFSLRSVLLRYVREAQRYSRRRPAHDVFRRNPGERYLSVNLLGVESSAEIASYYRELFQDGTGRVAICEHKLKQYNSASWEAGIRLTFVAGEGWTFSDTNGGRPVRMNPILYQQGRVYAPRRPTAALNTCGSSMNL